MVDIIITLIILAILGGAIGYIVYAKKHGAKCIGCPAGKQCSGHCSGGAGCACQSAAQGEAPQVDPAE